MVYKKMLMIYNSFVDIMHNEMNNKLESRVKVLNGSNNKRRRFKKKTGGITNWLKNGTMYVKLKKNFLNCPHTCYTTKKQMRKFFIEKRINFDKSVQKEKRQYWHRGREELVKLSDTDSKQLWQKMAKLAFAMRGNRTYLMK